MVSSHPYNDWDMLETNWFLQSVVPTCLKDVLCCLGKSALDCSLSFFASSFDHNYTGNREKNPMKLNCRLFFFLPHPEGSHARCPTPRWWLTWRRWSALRNWWLLSSTSPPAVPPRSCSSTWKMLWSSGSMRFLNTRMHRYKQCRYSKRNAAYILHRVQPFSSLNV